jgi:dGTPase
MPAEFSEPALAGDGPRRARVVADYIAGMTDRFAIAEHERLTA